jgi:predicted restriction endonuclease
MSYESKMLADLKMPPRHEVEIALLKSLFKHNGVIKEFSTEEEIVNELADCFSLNNEQRSARLETIYRKENRLKKSSLWHRLLFRAADSLASEKLIIRPSQTFKLTNKKEWILSEIGFDQAMQLLNIPKQQKEILPIKSYEVEKVVKKLKHASRPVNYNPFDIGKKIVKQTIETSLRSRGFRQAVIESYGFKCAVCGLKLNSPDTKYWEVEAAHIVPHSKNGKDDIWNGLSLCRLHHWAFDVGWFTLQDDFTIKVYSKIKSLPNDFGILGGYSFMKELLENNSMIYLPKSKNIIPHPNSVRWHRENVFFQ